MIHDSILKYVSPRRLGLSYHVQIIKRICYTVEEIEKIAKEELREGHGYEGVYIFCGINNLQKQDPKVVAQKVTSTVQNLQKGNPKLKIILSRVAPTNLSHLEKKRAIYNATLVSDLYGNCQNVFLVRHENLKLAHLNRDGIHPSRQATDTLAMNIGRCLRDLSWEPPTKLMKKINDAWWARNITSY